MKNAFYSLCILLLSAPAAPAQPGKSGLTKKAIKVDFNKNIELLGIAFFMGTMAHFEHDTTRMSNGVLRKEWFAWDISLLKKYRSFTTHPDLQTMARFGERHDGLHLARLLLHLADFPQAVLDPEKDAAYIRPFLRQEDSLASLREVVDFVAAANRLYRAMDLDQYFRRSERHYLKARREIQSVLPAVQLVLAMEKFYRQSFAGYALLPSLTIPAGMAFGVNHTMDGNTTIMNLFGPFAVQQFTGTAPLNMGFADEDHIRELSTHEFGHSFSNPAVDKIPAAWVKETAPLFEPVKEAMDNQGYNTWKSCLGEYFVRAGEVVIARKLGREAAAQKLLDYYTRGRQFIHLPLVIEELERYDGDPSMHYEQAVLHTMQRFRQLASGQ